MKRAAFVGLSAVIGFASGLFLQLNYRGGEVEVSCNSAWAGDSSCKIDSEGECSGACSKGHCARLPSKACGCVETKKN